MTTLAGTFYLGSFGQLLQITMTQPGSGSAFPIPQDSRYSFIFLTPDRRKIVVTPTLATTGLDGVMQYTIPRGFLDHVGTWKVQARVETDTSVEYSDPIVEFTVSLPLS